MNNDLNKLSIFGIALLLPAMAAGVDASEISNITPVTSNGANVYNINPANYSNGIGLRQYENFDLTKGDAANFIMTDISKFVNLVDNKVGIDGLVNTVNSDMSKNNGGLIFVSPQGFVVGSNGVINTGSLSVYTPAAESYNSLTEQLTEAVKNGNITFDPSTMVLGNGVITVDGKIVASGDVNFGSGKIVVGSNGRIISGLNADNTFMTYDKETGSVQFSNSEDIFNTLVNTGKTSSDNANVNFTTQDGNVELGGNVNAMNGSVNITVNNGNVLNTGTADTLITSSENITINAAGFHAGNVGEIPLTADDYTKSVNLNAGGKVNIYADNAVNISSLDSDLTVDEINAGDAVYLQVDGVNNGLFSSLEHKTGTANVTAGKNISITTAGDIGSSSTDNGGRFTISSTSAAQSFNTEAWNNDKFSYTPNTEDNGIEVVSKYGDIHLKDIDTSSNVANLSAEKGSADAQFKGNTYIGNVTVGQNAEILTQGDVLYVDTLENISSFDSESVDADGTEVHFTALGLDSGNNSDSVIILKDGAVQGTASDTSKSTLAFTADNIYADGQHFVLGKNGTASETDTNTSKITVVDTADKDGTVNIRISPVTENDVKKAEDSEGLSRVYYGGENDGYSYTIASSQSSNAAVTTADDTTSGDTTTDTDTDADTDIDITDDDSSDGSDIDEDDTSGLLDIDTDNDEDSDIPSVDSGSDSEPEFGDDDDDSGVDEPDIDTGDDDLDIGETDTDTDKDIDVEGDDDDNSSEPDISDDDDDSGVDEPDIDTGDDDPTGDLDDDNDNPLDTDDDKDDDIPSADDDDDNPDIGDDDTDIDKDDDNPLDTDDDKDDDIPSAGDDDDDNPDIGDDDTDTDKDDDSSFGDTDNDQDSDIPSVDPTTPSGNPVNPVEPSVPDINPNTLDEHFKGSTEPPKPLALVTDVRVKQLEDDNEVFSRLVNTNGLFGENEPSAEKVLAPLRKEAAQKRKFNFRWWFR